MNRSDKTRIPSLWTSVLAASFLAMGSGMVQAASAPQPLSDDALETYHATMSQIALPNKGCFKASYPSTVWQETGCVAAPERPYVPGSSGRSGPAPAGIGNGHDYVAQLKSGHISSTIGSFKSVTGLESESDGGSNDQFSLQLNSDFFETKACDSAVDPSSCNGWEQFVYSNSGVAFIQYWLIGYGTATSGVKWSCPASWNTSHSDCWRNADKSVDVPVQPIAKLAKLRLTGKAESGHSDTVLMTTPDGEAYAASNNDSELDLAKEWQASEFNLFGDCCGTQATVNGGVTMVVHVNVNNGTRDAPICAVGGFTGETNNLTLAATCSEMSGSAPAIEFAETIAPTSIWMSTGTACDGASCPGWRELDRSEESVRIAGGAANLYQLQNTGEIWQYDGTPFGNSGNGWKELDSNPNVVELAAEGNKLYELHKSGTIWGFTPCTGSSCPGWQELGNSANSLHIIADSSGLYQIQENGEIWRYTGQPCTGNTCKGWQMLDNNPAAVDIAATDGKLYELHKTGEIWRFTGTACSGSSCPGWQMLDNNPLNGRIEAAGGDLYQMHVPLAQHSRTLTCFECR